MNEQSNAKNIIIAILGVLLVASSGFGIYTAWKGPIMISKEGSKELCDVLPLLSTPLDESGVGSSPYIARDVCHFVFAIEKEDHTICENLKTGEFKAQCYATSASKKGDPSLCESAPIDVRDKCYSTLAQQMGGTEVCEKIQRQDDRDNCLSNQASRIGDGEFCTKIKNINIRDGCYTNQAYRDPAYCDKVTNIRMREDCQQNAMRR